MKLSRTKELTRDEPGHSQAPVNETNASITVSPRKELRDGGLRSATLTTLFVVHRLLSTWLECSHQLSISHFFSYPGSVP